MSNHPDASASHDAPDRENAAAPSLEAVEGRRAHFAETTGAPARLPAFTLGSEPVAAKISANWKSG